MKKFLITLFLCASALGQTHKTAMQDLDNHMTGKNTYALPIGFDGINFSALPVAVGQWGYCKDCQATTPCLGGGTGSFFRIEPSGSVCSSITSVLPAFACSPATLAFASIPIGSQSAVQTVTCTNTGTPAVTITSIASTGDFSQTNTCPASLNQGAACTIAVTFNPSAAGARSGTLSIASTAQGGTISVTLSGTGLISPTWSSVALSPATPTIIIPNSLQMAANYTPSAGNAVNGTALSYWSESGASGGSGGSFSVRGHTAAVVASGTSRACPAMNVTSGDLLIIGAYMYSSASLTTFTSGASDTQANSWTLLANLDQSGTRRSFIAWAVAGSTGSDTITATESSSVNYFGVKCADVSGQAATTPFDVSASQNAPTTTASMVTPAFTTTGSNDFCFALFADATGTNAPTPGTGWTTLDTDSTFRAISEWDTLSPAGSYTASATDVTATGTWQAYAACWKPAASIGQPFATVNQNGLVTAAVAGTATISAEGGEPVQQAQSVPVSATSSTTVTFPSAQTSGNTNVVKVSWGAASGSIVSVTDSAGNTYNCQAPEQGNALSVDLCIASPIAAFSTSGGVGNTVTVTMGQSTSNLDVIAEERAFTVASSLLDGAATNATGTSGAATASITTTNANDVVVVGLGLAQGISSVLSPFVADNIFPNNNSIVSAGFFATGTDSATVQLSGGAWVSQALALKVLGTSTSATIAAQTVSNVYYIAPSTASPPGADTNPCTQSQPCLTFAHIFSLIKSNGLGANGSTVFLENGVYSPSTGTGYLLANCAAGGNATSGTGSGAQVTFQALNDRQAEIDGSTSGIPALIQNCAWWTVQGIYFKNGDFTTQPSFNFDNVILTGVSNFTFTKNILAFNNRFQNSQLLSIQGGSTNVTVTNNEFYFFHRHGTQIFGGSNNVVFEQNYCNSRNYPDLSNGRFSSYPTTGDDCVITYGASNNVVANNIDENDGNVANCQPNGGQTCSNNSYLGNIGLNNIQSYWASSHQGTTCPGGTATSNCPSNQSNTFTNDVSISPLNDGYILRSGSYTITQGSVFTPRAAAGSGFGFGVFTDIDPTAPGSAGPYTATLTNDEVDGVPSGACSYQAGSGVSGTWSFIVFSPLTACSISAPNTVTFTNLLGRNFDFGSCRAWVPTTSNNHANGSGGLDIGANVLFKYDSTGTITTNPLWSSSASCKLGQTNCAVFTGAIVPGLNDVAGSSLYDVGTRLNIGQNGCSYPTGYTPAP